MDLRCDFPQSGLHRWTKPRESTHPLCNDDDNMKQHYAWHAKAEIRWNILTWWNMKEKLHVLQQQNQTEVTPLFLRIFKMCGQKFIIKPPAHMSHWKQRYLSWTTNHWPASTWGFSWQPFSLRASILSPPLPSMDHPWHRENPLFRLFWREFWWTTNKNPKECFFLWFIFLNPNSYGSFKIHKALIHNNNINIIINCLFIIIDTHLAEHVSVHLKNKLKQQIRMYLK